MVFDVLVISLQASPWKVQVIIADCSVWKALIVTAVAIEVPLLTIAERKGWFQSPTSSLQQLD